MGEYIKMYHKGIEWECVDSICLVQNRKQGQAVVKMVVIIRDYRTRETFFIFRGLLAYHE